MQKAVLLRDAEVLTRPGSRNQANVSGGVALGLGLWVGQDLSRSVLI